MIPFDFYQCAYNRRYSGIHDDSFFILIFINASNTGCYSEICFDLIFVSIPVP